MMGLSNNTSVWDRDRDWDASLSPSPHWQPVTLFATRPLSPRPTSPCRYQYLWLRQSEMTRSMSASLTSVRPSKATSAFAARLTTMSPRRPSTFKREQMSEMRICGG